MNLNTCTIATIAFVFVVTGVCRTVVVAAIVIDDDDAFVFVAASATPATPAAFVFIKTKTDVESKAIAPAQHGQGGSGGNPQKGGVWGGNAPSINKRPTLSITNIKILVHPRAEPFILD